MALFDFFRRRKDQAEQRHGIIRGFLSRLFNRRRIERPESPRQEARTEIQEEPDIDIDDDLFNAVEDIYKPPESEQPRNKLDTDIAQVTTVSDETLMIRYRKMLDTMVNKGYIDAFDSDADAAEFLRVLSSEAWEEAHAYWYSVDALQQIQDAILKGATARSLQDEYNEQKEQQSDSYLATWENWIHPAE